MSDQCIATLVPGRQVTLNVAGRELGTVLAGYWVQDDQDRLLRDAGYVRVSTWECIGPERDYHRSGDAWTATVQPIGADDE